MNKSEKEVLFDAEKSIYELRETIRGRGRELSHGEFAGLTSGFLNGLVFALNTFNIEMSKDFGKEALALMDRIID